MRVRRPTSIKIIIALFCVFVLFFLFAGTVFILESPIITMGLTFYALGLTTALITYGLWNGRFRGLAMLYITFVVVCFLGMFLMDGITANALSNLIVIGIPTVIVYILLLSLLCRPHCVEFCETYGGKTVPTMAIIRALGKRKGKETTEEPEAEEPIEEPIEKPMEEPIKETHAEDVPKEGPVFGRRQHVSEPNEEPINESPKGESVTNGTEPVFQPVANKPDEPEDDGFALTGIVSGPPADDDSTFRFCIECGFDLSRIPRTAKHCPQCGKPIMWGAAHE